MFILSQLFRSFKKHAQELSWPALMLLMALHSLSVWLMLNATEGEEKLVSGQAFFYFYITTATTVGYGDLSPVTLTGRLITTLWLMPGGIGLFAALIGKTSGILINLWRLGMQGKRDYRGLSDHIVLIGWHGDRSVAMVDLLRDDPATKNVPIILCASEVSENPLPEQVLFVRGESLACPELLERAAIQTASRILIYGTSDDQTLATALAVGSCQSRAHVVVHFEQQARANLLKRHYPNMECTSSLTVEMLVRSAQDPGSSLVTGELLSVLSGPTQYLLRLPQDFPGQSFGTLFRRFKEQHNATLLAHARDAQGLELALNPPDSTHVAAGDCLYYMADQRLNSDALSALSLRSLSDV